MQRYFSRVVCGLTLAVLVSCNTPPSGPLVSLPSTPTSPSPPPSASRFSHLLGNYALTIQIDDTCSNVPGALRLRAYDAVLEDGPFSPGRLPVQRQQYMTVRVVGGGFSEPAYVADVWDRGDSRLQLEWNEDIGGCSDPEPLTNSTQLYLCGSGPAILGDSTISGVMVGPVYIRGSGPEIRCTGAHQFRLNR